MPDAPPVPGLEFRGFSGDEDYPKLHKVILEEKIADKDDFLETLDDLIKNYKHLVNCDINKDMLLAEIDGVVIGYSRVWWIEKQQGGLIFPQFVCLTPNWRGKGIRRAMLKWNEFRLSQIAESHHKGGTKEYRAWVSDTEHDWKAVLESEGYKPIRYSFVMVRQDMENIPEIPLPEGLEVKTVKPEDYRKVWDADCEAFKDAWEPIIIEEEMYKRWLAASDFQPELWEVAWDGDRIAGAVQNFINEEENKIYNRKRGYTEGIHVGKSWRGKGLGKALIGRSLKLLKEKGMEEAALGVDAENPTGALQLYQSMGFEEIKRYTTFRKPLAD